MKGCNFILVKPTALGEKIFVLSLRDSLWVAPVWGPLIEELHLFLSKE